MPELVKMYIRNVAIGFVVAAIFVGLLLGFDVSGLRGLIFGSDAGLLALGMIWFVNGIVFAGVQFAWAVMSMAEKEPRTPRGGLRVTPDLVPVRVRAEKAKRPF